MAKGNVSRGGSDYRDALMDAALKDKDHPLHFGFSMQAHHLLSDKGISQSGMGDKLVDLGYEINELENLLFLPYDLNVACHLGVQMHRSNHNFIKKLKINYHVEVKELVSSRQVKTALKRCNNGVSDAEAIRNVQKLMDSLSEDVLDMIKDFELPLTVIYKDFDPKNNEAKGCANAGSVPAHRASNHKCNVGFDHSDTLFNGSNVIPATLKKHSYTLKVGR